MTTRKNEILQIIGDGAIATSGLGEGRMVPVVVIDSSQRGDIEELILNHIEGHPGDVMSRWGIRPLFPKLIFLHLEFMRPSKIDFYIPFNIGRHLGLIEGIHISRGLYVQPSSSGKSVSEGMGKAKILVEIPPETKLGKWDQYAHAAATKKFIGTGIPKKEARIAAEKAIKEIRNFWEAAKIR